MEPFFIVTSASWNAHVSFAREYTNNFKVMGAAIEKHIVVNLAMSKFV